MEREMKTYMGRLGRFLATLAQVGALVGFWWLCDFGVRAAGLPVPAGVVGLAVLVALLASGRLPARWLHRGANGLMNHMLLFFVPAIITLRDHPELVSVTGLKLLAVIVVGIVSVMAGTALIVELHFQARAHHDVR
jgi:holin-like protein